MGFSLPSFLDRKVSALKKNRIFYINFFFVKEKIFLFHI